MALTWINLKQVHIVTFRLEADPFSFFLGIISCNSQRISAGGKKMFTIQPLTTNELFIYVGVKTYIFFPITIGNR